MRRPLPVRGVGKVDASRRILIGHGQGPDGVLRNEAVAAATEHELKEQQRLIATEDSREGIRSVAERRPGNFKGR